MKINTLENKWHEYGIKKNDKLLLHSSFKRTFNELSEQGYNFSPQDILESLIEAVLPEGTLILPTFNFEFNETKKYNYYKTKSKMGIVTELARNSTVAKRTLNPVYSFAVFGNDAYKFDGLNNISWYSKESPFEIIHNENYKIGILDLTERYSQTFAHYCEEFFQVDWRYYKEFSGDYTDKDNKTSHRTYKGYVRKIEKGVQTTLDPAGEILWERGKYFGDRPLENSGFRYIFSQDYFNLFEELFKKKKCNPNYFKITKSNS